MRVGLVDEVAAGYSGSLLLRGADVDVDLAAGAAGAGVAHLPEIVVLVAEHDVVFGKVAQPCLLRLFVHRGLVRALEDGGVEQALVYLVNFGEKFPRPVYGFVLEIVAEAPVAEHLEHRVVVCVVAHFFKVVVLSADAEALLRVGGAERAGFGIAEEYILELVHPGVGEHQRRVVLYYHGCRRDHRVALRGEEIEKLLANLL